MTPPSPPDPAREQATPRWVSRATLETLLETSPEAVVVVDPQRSIVAANAQAARLFQYSGDELAGLHLDDLLGGEQGTAGRRKDGTEFPAGIEHAAGGGPDGLAACIVRDLTVHWQVEEERFFADRRARHILETMPCAFFALDREWRFQYVNAKAAEIAGRNPEELRGRTLWEEFPEIVDSVFCQEYRRAVREHRPAAFTAFDSKRRLWLEVHVQTSDAGLDVYFQDVTVQKTLEEQSGQSLRLEALGRLAGGVAHDFNNLLTIIGGYGQMLLDAVGTRSPLRKDVEPIVEAAARASGLTRQLLAFSRRQHVQPKVVDVNRLITRMSKMLRRVLGEDIELKLDLRSGIGRTLADPGQIEQVIMNLAVNARDAMPMGGTLRVVTDNLELKAGNVAAGSYVLLAMEDTGGGMEPQTRLHLFEPFFTTKAQGTGLGLATVYNIVKQAGGEIEVESAPQQGTCFRIYLPRSRKETRERKAGGARRPRKGSETILLVEDEPDVRRIARDMLERLGYRVLDAGDATEALAVWNNCTEPIELLVTDVIMPQASGRELARTLTTLRPGLKVLYISGYTDEIVGRHGIDQNDIALLAKPFSRETLGLKVRSILDAGRDA
ncbi:MAG TPA: ATP-binding protein [Bryobacteraceae bacterium]|nr:ATP-binding protein [Bryobacteraceae bacterium]